MTRVQHERKNLLYMNIFPHPYIYYIASKKSQIGNALSLCQYAFQKYIIKTWRYNGKRYIKKLKNYVVAANALARFRIVMQSNAVPFLIKIILCETTNILFGKNFLKQGKMNEKRLK